MFLLFSFNWFFLEGLGQKLQIWGKGYGKFVKCVPLMVQKN
jgi:hypothetical protein